MIDFLFNLNRPGEIIEKFMIYDDFTVTQIICRVQSFVEIFWDPFHKCTNVRLEKNLWDSNKGFSILIAIISILLSIIFGICFWNIRILKIDQRRNSIERIQRLYNIPIIENGIKRSKSVKRHLPGLILHGSRILINEPDATPELHRNYIKIWPGFRSAFPWIEFNWLFEIYCLL